MEILVKKCMADKFIFGGYTFDNYFVQNYPFTTENISGYLPLFDLENKSLLTVGSSLDQVMNATLYGCKEIDVIDLCPFICEYFYLKRAAIEVLTREEFLNFFCYMNYPKSFVNNDCAFNLPSYFMVREVLKEINYDAFWFWDSLFSEYGGLKVRSKLFKNDELLSRVLLKVNSYLSSDMEYLKLRSMLYDININFIIGDIFDTELTKNYDNIFLSNICAYNEVIKLKELFDRLLLNLNDDGRILIAYLYQTVRDTKYNDDWLEIYDIENTLRLFSDNVDFSSFIGVKGILHNDELMKDSVITYKKVKKM